MRILLLSDPPDLSAYLAELFAAWGLPLCEIVGPGPLPPLDPADVPVVLCPEPRIGHRHAAALVDYVRRGGALVCFLPDGELAAAAGLEDRGEKEGPLRLRVTEYPAAGVSGEQLPIAGPARTFAHGPDARPLAYLSHPGRYDGESAAITETPLENGVLVAFAFDPARCVLLLRQGDPARAERIPPGDGCARPSHLAVELGPHEAGWMPYADLISRLLLDAVRRRFPIPVPLLSHLPGSAPGILLYSGDEDGAEVAWNDEELDCVAAAGGRMNLYLIPTHTHSTPADVRRYLARGDLGPHPNLRPLDGQPVSARLEEFGRQIRMFQDMFHLPARTLRNHCTAWAGYMQPVETMEKLGVRMDANYFSGTYMRGRESAPYAPFGGALPVRFCQPDGRVCNVFQQHTHLTDDGFFGVAPYSYKLSPEVFSGILDRTFRDIATRFHTPYGVCIHPSNWVRFSRSQGKELLRQATEKGLPIWSFDQWSAFWEARDTWRFSRLSREGAGIRLTLEGTTSHSDLRLLVPVPRGSASPPRVTLNGDPVDGRPVVRYGHSALLLPLEEGTHTATVRIIYDAS